MKQEEVIERLKEELNLPFFNGTLEEKNYSEADYQQIKKELIHPLLGLAFLLKR